MVNERWDAVIVGAGPAGAVAAALLAHRGWQVLLLERSRWPRDKVCGGCLNAAALALLRDAGFATALRMAKPNRLHRLSLNIRRQKLSLALPEGLAIPRTCSMPNSLTKPSNAAPSFSPTRPQRFCPLTLPNHSEKSTSPSTAPRRHCKQKSFSHAMESPAHSLNRNPGPPGEWRKMHGSASQPPSTTPATAETRKPTPSP